MLCKNSCSYFAKFKGKHLCQSLFLNKVASFRPATLLKKRLWHKCFPINFEKSLRMPFLRERLWWLLLHFYLLFPITQIILGFVISISMIFCYQKIMVKCQLLLTNLLVKHHIHHSKVDIFPTFQS